MVFVSKKSKKSKKVEQKMLKEEIPDENLSKRRPSGINDKRSAGMFTRDRSLPTRKKDISQALLNLIDTQMRVFELKFKQPAITMTEMNLSNCSLKKLPFDIRKFSHLTELKVHDNKI